MDIADIFRGTRNIRKKAKRNERNTSCFYWWRDWLSFCRRNEVNHRSCRKKVKRNDVLHICFFVCYLFMVVGGSDCIFFI